MKHLEPDGEGTYRFVDNGKVTAKEKRELLDLDDAYYEVYQYHIITNLDELNQ